MSGVTLLLPAGDRGHGQKNCGNGIQNIFKISGLAVDASCLCEDSIMSISEEAEKEKCPAGQGRLTTWLRALGWSRMMATLLR